MPSAKKLANWVAASVVAAGFNSAAHAAVIVDQEPTAGFPLENTLYTAVPQNSVLEIDSFTTTAAYRLGVLTAFVRGDGPGPTDAVTASIYSGGPPGGPNASLVDTASGALDDTLNLVVNFEGALLPAGTYYLTAFPIRNGLTGGMGIWYWNTSFTGPQALTWPIGDGGAPALETNPFTTQPLALAYTLTGTLATPAPELPAWALFGGGFALVGLLTTRRRSHDHSHC